MLHNEIYMNAISFRGGEYQTKSRKEKVGEAAAVTGGVGAGVAATKGGSAFNYFKSSEQLRNVVNSAAKTSEAIVKPAQQSKSLWNAFKLNCQNLRAGIAKWANASKMPKFMKTMFNGGLGKALGGVAALFVFVTGISEVAKTFLGNVNKISEQASFDNYPYA